MPIHPEHERTRGAPGEEDESGAQPETGLRGRLKVVAHYLMPGFAPVVAVIALAAAVFAIADKRSGESRMNEVITELQNVNANLTATRSELESLKFIVTRQRAQLDAEKRQDEMNDRIVQNVTRLQEKLKVSPTLQEQLLQSASAPVAAPAASASPAAEKAAEKPPEQKAPAAAATPTAPAKAVTKVPEPKTAPKAAAPTSSENKSNKQLQGIKEAIEKFNKK